MNKEFLATLEKKETDYQAIFQKLYLGVIETNKLIGLDPSNMSEEEREALIETYFLLRVEEGKEVAEAVEKEDKFNLINELIDVLVVAGFESYLLNGYIFDEDVTNPWAVEGSVEDTIDYSKMSVELINTLTSAQDSLIGMNCNLELAVDEVLRANLSKFPTELELEDKLPLEERDGIGSVFNVQIALLEMEGRYAGVTCDKVVDDKGEERFVFWSTTEYGVPKRKYLKPVTFQKANMNNVWK